MADKEKQTDEDVLALARQRFERCVAACGESRTKARDDIRFAAASPDDPWHWPERDRKAREMAGRPCLTINKLPAHINQVLNDVRQNRPSIKFRAASDQATAEVADILSGIARHIEAISDADVAYDTASQHQVTSGEGFWRVLPDYVSESAFEQDIFIRRIKDPFRVWLDPDAEDPCGADAQFAFLEESLSEDEFKEQYPDADAVNWDFQTYGDWYTADKQIRVAEYFSLERRKAKLLMWATGATSFEGDEKLPPGVVAGEVPIREREVARAYVCWRKMSGAQVLDKREWKMQYIPIVRVLGNEWMIDGKVITSGLIRGAKDAARMYNVAASAITERVMMAPKAPWVGPAEAFEGYEAFWDSANTSNFSRLPYNHRDSQSQEPLPPPQRVSPAPVEPGLQQILLHAADDQKSTMGQFDASLGAQGNETSGKAIMARQREGDTATFHYVDNLARSVRHTGRIILGFLPIVYDHARVMRVIGEDGTEEFANLAPELERAYAEDEASAQRVFNPLVGVYDVVASAGPSFTTRRVEAVQAMTEMTQANPELWGVIGDHLVKNMDWPGADEMAKRLKAVLVPAVRQAEEAEGQGIPPEAQAAMAQMTQQLQQMGQALAEAQQAAEGTQIKAQIDAEKIEVERYKAETERMQALAPAVAPEQVQAIVAQTVQEIMNPQVMPA